MKPEKQKENPSPRKKRGSSNLLFIPILVMFVVSILFFLTSNRQESGSSSQETGKKQPGIWGKITRAFSDEYDQLKHALNQKNTGETSKGLSRSDATQGGDLPVVVTKDNLLSDNGQQTTPMAGSEQPVSPATDATLPTGTADSPRQAGEKINAFYSHLDTQPYLLAFHLEKPSSVYCTELIQKLLDNRPVVIRETDDLLTIVKNTAHFFRVIGKDNITILKTILDQERPYLEDMLADYYALTEFPDGLQKTLSLRVPSYALYEYAGFFLNTMGGRLYLFRRDPVTRMTVTYYGILIIDRANRESNNRDGIQIKQAVDSLITDIEDSSSQLRFKERYLDKLYELKEKYQ
jgi:hypothetical protein